MTKGDIAEKVKALINTPSCCAELKAVGNDWLKALGEADEKMLSEKLLKELEADRQPIDDVIALFSSETGKNIVGAETAANMAAHFKEVKAAGGKWCDCPACKIAGEILDNKAVLV